MDQPQPKMPAWKAVTSIAIGVIFDLLKFVFSILVFTGPVMAGEAVKIYTALHSWPSWASWLAGWVVTVGSGVLEFAFPLLAAAVAFFGIIMAIMVGFFGTLVLYGWFLANGVNPFHPKRLLVSAATLIASIIPFIDMLPTLTAAAVLTVRSARREDRKALKVWKAQSAAAEQQTQARRAEAAAQLEQQQQAELAAAQEAQMAEEAAIHEEMAQAA
jgi:hypothetical protein